MQEQANLIFYSGFGGGNFGFGFGEVLLKFIALLHLVDDGLREYAPNVNNRWMMLGNFNAVPAHGTRFSNDGVTLGRKQINEHQCEHR